MAGLWNPNAPNVIGNEFRGVYAYLDKATKSPFKAMKLRSTIAETITEIQLVIGPTINTSSPLFKILAIYNANNIVLGDDGGEFHAAPDAHGTGTGIGNWRTQAGSATTIYTSIDDTVKYPPVGSDYIRTTGAISNAFFHMNTGAFPLTARVGRLLIRGVVGTGGTYRDIYFRLWHVPSGTLYTPPGDRVRAHYYGLLHTVDLGDINPVTLLPWSPVDIRGFEAANNVWQVRVTGAGSVANPLQLHNLELLVQYSATERRVAVATWQRPPGSSAGVSVSNAAGSIKHLWLDQLVHPDGAGNWVADWAKPSSGDFVFVWHNALDRLVGGAEPRAQDIHWQFIGGNDRDGLIGSPVPGQAAGDVVFGAASSQVQGEVFSAGPFDQPLAGGVQLVRSDLLTSDDSQPYRVNYHNNALQLAEASDTVDVAQRFSAPATDSYGGLRFQIKPPADGSLLVTVHVDATGAQVGGSFEVDAATLTTQPSLTNMPGFKDVRGVLSSAAALTSGTFYYLRFRKFTGTPGSTWGLVRMDAYTVQFAGDEATFQGATGYHKTLNRSTGSTIQGYNEEDLPVQLIAAPDDPLNVVATKLSQPIAADYEAVGGPQCGPAALDYARITWNSPGTYTGAGFLQWDIERREPDGVTWTRIGVSAEEGLSSFEDYEAIRNRSNLRYRVRARTADAGFSGWVETGDLDMVTEECEILFTSNARPDLNVGYTFEPRVSYDFIDHDADELMRLSGVPYQAGFIDATNRGVTGSYELVANFKDQPVDPLGNPIGGEVIFEPLRRIIRSDYQAELLLPYICVLDYEGNRRFAYVRLTDGRRSEPAHHYKTGALVVPLTDMPTVIRREALTSSALLLDGSGDLISTPHVSTLGITGDIELRWEVEFGPTGFATIQTVASKWDAGSQGSWILQHESANNGRPRLIWTPNGTVGSQIIGLANATPPWDLANRMAFKATLDVNDGAGNWDLNFYWALRHGGPYTQLGTTVTAAGITSLFNTTSAPLRIGAHSGTSEPFTGLVYEFDLFNGLAGTDRRVDLNLRGYKTFGTPQITDTAGRIYSYSGNAQIIEVAGVV